MRCNPRRQDARLRSRTLLLLALTRLSGACGESGPAAGAARLQQADAAGADIAFTCGTVGYQGCCRGRTLRYCAAGHLVEKDCSPAQCGWDPLFRVYACGASSASDPAGLPRKCPASDAGLADRPASDAALPAPDSNACGAVSYVGCCAGAQVLFCAGGALLTLDCSGDPHCGWDPAKSYYTCGTDGQADPSGNHPRACGVLPADGGASDARHEVQPDFPAVDQSSEPRTLEAGSPTLDRRRHQEGGADTGTIPGLDPTILPTYRDNNKGDVGSDGCGCAVEQPGADRRPAAALWAILALLLVAVRRCRW